MPSSPSSPFIARPFSETWTLEQTRAWLTMQETRPAQISSKTASSEERKRYDVTYRTWQETVYTPLTSSLTAKMAEHLQWLAQQGKVTPPANIDHIRSRWLEVLHALIAHPEKPLNDHDARTLTSPWRMDVFILGVDAALRADATGTLLHNAVHAMMTEGSFAFPLPDDTLTCQNSGKRLALKVKDWQFQLGSIDYTKKRDEDFTPLTPTSIPPQGIHHVTLPVPSGEIWINNWFNLEAFVTQAATFISYAQEDSVNYVGGCARRTTHQAEGMGFLCVRVEDTGSHYVASHDGRLEIGYVAWNEEDDEETISRPLSSPSSTPLPNASLRTKLAPVSTDRGLVTLIDRHVLEDHLATKMERTAAQEALVAYQEENEGDLKVIQVQPGTYHAYFAGSPDVFAARFHADGVDLAAFDQPVLVVSPTPLVLKEKHEAPPPESSPSSLSVQRRTF